MDRELKFLKVSAVIFKVLAWISTVFFIIVSFIVLLGAGGDTPRAAGIIFLLGGAIYFLILFTAAELIKVVVSISNKVDRLGDLLEGKPSV
ncbi:MAG: hypothetical protein L6416_12395 [Candidatus Omnitrophica bacterium]|nr:hypothetical protein [Candidatus Omnitrophota bacterium]